MVGRLRFWVHAIVVLGVSLRAMPTAAEWRLNLRKSNPPEYLVSQESQPPGLQLTFSCRPTQPAQVRFAPLLRHLNEGTPLPVEFVTPSTTRLWTFRHQSGGLGTWRPAPSDEVEIAQWLEGQRGLSLLKLVVTDFDGKRVSVDFFGEIAGQLAVLRGYCR
jgi:hypothetical protein